MKFIQNNGVYALQLGIGKKAAREHAFSQKKQPGFRTGYPLKANLVANRVANVFAELPSHALGSQARGNAPRLEYQHLAAHCAQQSRRNASRLSSARLGLDHEIRSLLKSRQESPG